MADWRSHIGSANHSIAAITMKIVMCLLLLALTACSPPPLAGAYQSADALARDLLDAVERKDAAALRAIALDEQEFREQVWPGLPVARPERNMPIGYVWGDLRQKSDAGLTSVLGHHGGTRYELVKVAFAGEVSQYPGFRVHRDAVLTVRDRSGTEHALRLCGSMVEKDNRWKVFSYVAND